MTDRRSLARARLIIGIGREFVVCCDWLCWCCCWLCCCWYHARRLPYLSKGKFSDCEHEIWFHWIYLFCRFFGNPSCCCDSLSIRWTLPEGHKIKYHDKASNHFQPTMSPSWPSKWNRVDVVWCVFRLLPNLNMIFSRQNATLALAALHVFKGIV